MFLLGLIVTILALISLPGIAEAGTRSGTDVSGVKWSEEVYQVQPIPHISLDTREWILNIKLNSTRPINEPNSSFQKAVIDTAYKLPYGNWQEVTRERYNIRAISVYDKTEYVTHLSVKAYITYTHFKWTFSGEPVRDKYLGATSYTFIR